MAEMIPDHSRIPPGLKRGDNGPTVRVLQEHLTLAGHPLLIDGDFGPATERALMLATRYIFGGQKITDAATNFDLTQPMYRALSATGSILTIARAYLTEHPREVGGNNRGPWVRTFTDGFDGPAYLWCAYFMRHLSRQAGEPWAERISSRCDTIGARAKADGRFSTTPHVGGLFLVRRDGAPGWRHTGLVTDAGPGWVTTIEGNANDEGTREGHEVCSRTRGLSRLDFVKLGA
jgi:hypothetical protein